MRSAICCAAGAMLLGALFAAPPAGAASALESQAVGALRAAADAAGRGEHQEAAAHFEQAASIAEIEAPARLQAARAWLDAGDPARSERAVRAALDAGAAAPWEAELFEALARARLASGDEAGARRAWSEALARGFDPARANEVRLALADSLAASGEIAAAAVVLREAWIDAAARAGSDRAEQRFAALESRAGRTLRTPHDWVERANGLFAAQRTEAALAAYERALASGITGPERTLALRRRADCLFRSRRYPEAVEAFAAIDGDAEARIWRARARARAGDVETALVELEAIAKAESGATAGWAAQLAGLLHEGRGRDEAARVLFAVAAREGDAKVAGEALWRLGFSAYRARDLETARVHLEALVAREPDPVQRLAARYWSARARGDASDALAAIAREYPFTFYGGEAAALLRARGAPVPAGEGAAIEEGGASFDERDLLPPRVFAAAGLHDVALRACETLAARAASAADRVAIARLYAEAGDAFRAQSILVRNHAELLAHGPARGAEAVWRLAWPDAYAAERRAALSRPSPLDPWLVAALMREESGYRADAVSVTGAVGLLQLMPDTARRLARDVGIVDVAPARWIEPALNVRLGTAYLEQLTRRFGDRTAAVIASYNAGPAVVETWRQTPGSDTALWIESIPYEETRGYVKRVLRSLRIYQALYR